VGGIYTLKIELVEAWKVAAVSIRFKVGGFYHLFTENITGSTSATVIHFFLTAILNWSLEVPLLHQGTIPRAGVLQTVESL